MSRVRIDYCNARDLGLPLNFSLYRGLLSVQPRRRVLIVGMIARLPYSAAGVILTLHIVMTLGQGYGAAGTATAVMTIGIALGAMARSAGRHSGSGLPVAWRENGGVRQRLAAAARGCRDSGAVPGEDRANLESDARLGRTAAPCRDCSWWVSAARPPNPACASQRTGLSARLDRRSAATGDCRFGCPGASGDNAEHLNRSGLSRPTLSPDVVGYLCDRGISRSRQPATVISILVYARKFIICMMRLVLHSLNIPFLLT